MAPLVGRPPTGSSRSSSVSPGGDVYDKWVSHEVLFDSPEITKAMDTLAGWMKNPDYVNAGFGNVQTIATTAFQDAGKPILDGKCGMLQQASFYAAQWESFKPGAIVAEDGDVFAFYLPADRRGRGGRPGRRWRRVHHRVLGSSRGPGRSDLPVLARVRDRSRRAARWLGLGEQRRSAGHLHRRDRGPVGAST